MKSIKFGLLPRILLAIALGVATGFVMPEGITRVFLTFNGIFNQLLGFAIPLIIVGMVIPAISDLGRSAGRMLLLTVALAYGATLVAGGLSYLTGALTFPTLISSQATEQIAQGVKLTPYFSLTIPPLMDVMTALVTAFLMGLGIAYIKGDVLRRAATEF